MERDQQIRELGRLKAAFSGPDHPNITVAFDAAEAVLIKVVGAGCDQRSAANLVRMMFRSVMDAGFMIIHREEMHDALLAAGAASKILGVPPHSEQT